MESTSEIHKNKEASERQPHPFYRNRRRMGHPEVYLGIEGRPRARQPLAYATKYREASLLTNGMCDCACAEIFKKEAERCHPQKRRESLR